jgi:hypothetical protein
MSFPKQTVMKKHAIALAFIALAALVNLFCLAPSSAAADELVAVSSFEVDVTPPLGSPLCNGNRPPAMEISTPLSARGIVILNAGKPILICALDWVGIANESHARFRQSLVDAVGTDVDRVAVHTLHQHDAPGSDFAAERLLAEHVLGGLYSNPEFDARVAGQIAYNQGGYETGIVSRVDPSVERVLTDAMKRLLDDRP